MDGSEILLNCNRYPPKPLQNYEYHEKNLFGQFPLVHPEGHLAGTMKRHEIDLGLYHYKVDVHSDGHCAGRG